MNDSVDGHGVMPALPKGRKMLSDLQSGVDIVFSEEQMHAYARAYAFTQTQREREFCALEALRHTSHPDAPTNDVWRAAYDHVANEIAAAIRARNPGELL